jgi:hypothetical protein
MPHDIFISYSSKDKPTADALCATLEQRGLRCWMAPRDVLPGADWSEAIIDAITSSKALVLVYSEHANTSPQVRREIERAVHKGIAIVPLRIEDVPMSKSLEYFISTPHWLDALTPPLQRHLDYLADTLERFVDSRKAPPPTPIPGAASQAPATQIPPPPPAAPVPPPLAANRRLPLIAAAAVSVLVIAALAYFAGSRTNSTGSATGDPPPSGSVPRELLGTWIAQTAVNGLPITVETSVDGNGQSKVISTFRDQGRYGSNRGQWSMVNTAGTTTSGTYRFLSDGVMSMTGPLGTATWTRDAASPPDSSGRLSGTWTTAGTSPDGLPATTTLIFAPNSTYQLIARSEESAKLEAGSGRWRSVSSATGRVTEGTYQFVSPDVLAWATPTGTLNYKRR